MAMDDRQKQIRERAGLEESRLNQEFIDFLGKASWPILLVAAVSVLGYAGWQRWEKAQDSKIDKAFDELQKASDTIDPNTRQIVPGNPASLIDIADRFVGQGSVSHLARLKAADAYLQAVRQMVKLGTKIEQGGVVKDPAATLDGPSRREYLAKAKELYQRVLTDTEKDKGKLQLTIGAAFGLAAVAESEPNFEDAKKAYERVVALTIDSTFAAQGEIAKRRMNDMGALKTLPTLYADAQLPKPPEPVKPALPMGPTLDGKIDLSQPLLDRPPEPEDFKNLTPPAATDKPAEPPAPPATPPTNPK